MKAAVLAVAAWGVVALASRLDALHSIAVRNSECAAVDGTGEVRMDPVTGAMLGLKYFGLAAKAAASLAMAKVTADIEMQSQKLEEINKELKASIADIQKLLSDATGEAQLRMFDAITCAARALITASSAAHITTLYKSVCPGCSDANAGSFKQRKGLLAMLQTEYDVLLGLNGQSSEKNEEAREGNRLLSLVAPTLADLQDVMLPETDESAVKKVTAIAKSVEEHTGSSPPDVPHLIMSAASDELHAAIRNAKRKHAVTADNALAGARINVNSIDRSAGAAAGVSAALIAEDEANYNNLADEAYGAVAGAVGGVVMDLGHGKSIQTATNFVMKAPFTGDALDKMEAGMAAASALVDFGKSMVAVYAILSRGTEQFIVRRNVGIARESMQATTAEALVSACRLLHLLYDQLRTFSAIDPKTVPDLAWEQLLGAEKLTEGMKKDDLGKLRVAIHSLFCDAFAPLRKRLPALFRNDGRCVPTEMYYNSEDAASLTLKLTQRISGTRTTVATDASTTSSVLDCHPFDIMDLVLSSNDPKDRKYLEDWNYTLVNSPTWPTGELNAANLKTAKAKRPEHSRVFFTLSCEALRRNMATDPKLLEKYPYAALPITDVRILVRPASSTTTKQLDTNGKPVEKTIDTDRLTTEEKDLIKSGYSQVSLEFVGGPKPPTALTVSKIMRKVDETWTKMWSFWNGERIGFAHDDPADLKVDQDSNYPAIFAYARRGGPTPLVALSVLPYSPPQYHTKELSDTTIMSLNFRKEWEKRPPPSPRKMPRSGKVLTFMKVDPKVGDEVDADQPDVSTPSFVISCTNEVNMTGCTRHEDRCVSSLHVRLMGFKEDRDAGLKNQLQRVFLHRSISAAKGVKTDDIEYGFKFSCRNSVRSPYRWQRIPQPLYEGKDQALIHPYLWQLKRYVVVPLPDTTIPTYACPDICALRQGNEFVAAAQLDGDIARRITIASNSTGGANGGSGKVGSGSSTQETGKVGSGSSTQETGKVGSGSSTQKTGKVGSGSSTQKTGKDGSDSLPQAKGKHIFLAVDLDTDAAPAGTASEGAASLLSVAESAQRRRVVSDHDVMPSLRRRLPRKTPA